MLMLMTVCAVVLVPARVLLSDPKFQVVVWWCGIVAVCYLLFGISGRRLLRQEKLQVDETRRKILADQIEKRDADKEADPPAQ